MTEEGFGDAEDESDDSYVPGSQGTSKSRFSGKNIFIYGFRKNTWMDIKINIGSGRL